ncbi:hypothetical protein GCM10007978_35720 [Shewanella hanedai]|nr:hypothetical protein GCM10007978_35720 [Shewanella hanedai]
MAKHDETPPLKYCVYEQYILILYTVKLCVKINRVLHEGSPLKYVKEDEYQYIIYRCSSVKNYLSEVRSQY